MRTSRTSTILLTVLLCVLVPQLAFTQMSPPMGGSQGPSGPGGPTGGGGGIGPGPGTPGGGGVTVSPPSPPQPPQPPGGCDFSAIPEKAQWESQMTSFGHSHCQNLVNPSWSFDQKLAATYYDAQWVFEQIAEYTGDNAWHLCAARVEAIYRDQYTMPNSGYIPGYWNFTHGMTEDYLRTSDSLSRTAVNLIAKNAAYARDTTQTWETESYEQSRETAYAIMAYLNAERMGADRRERLALLVDHALGHLDQWTVSETAAYVPPFMVGLTAHALISYDEAVGDERILPAVGIALDWIWDNTWLPAHEAFQYYDVGDTAPAPDLNLLIAPAYAWVYNKTCEQRFKDRGDQVFAGGVRHAWLGGPKQFNQNYRWSFAYIAWREDS